MYFLPFQVRLLVKPVTGSPFQLVVGYGDTAEKVATRLSAQCGLPAGTFRLQFRGKYVHGHNTPFHSAAPGEMLRMLVKAPLCGGARLKQGFLKKKPRSGHMFSSNSDHFFVLLSDVLQWYRDEALGSGIHGEIPISHVTHVKRTGEELLIQTGQEKLVLLSKSEDELKEWEEALKQQVKALQPQALPAPSPGMVQAPALGSAPASVSPSAQACGSAVSHVASWNVPDFLCSLRLHEAFADTILLERPAGMDDLEYAKKLTEADVHRLVCGGSKLRLHVQLAEAIWSEVRKLQETKTATAYELHQKYVLPICPALNAGNHVLLFLLCMLCYP